MPHTQNERNIVFLSELKHVDMLDVFLTEHPAIREEGFLLVPLDLEIEYALTDKGIPFRSGGSYRTKDASTATLSEDWTASVFESKRWSFFTYRGVSLSRLHFLSLQWYLSHVIYYADIVTNVLRMHAKAVRLVVFSEPLREYPTGSILVGLQIRALADVVECIAAESGREVIAVSAPVQPSGTLVPPVPFAFKRALFGAGIGILNALITLLRRPRRIRALASDYWKNLAPYVHNVDSLEIVLIDRQEAFKAGLSNIWRFRMRFLHTDSFTSDIPPEHRAAHDRIAKEFDSIQNGKGLQTFEYRGFSLRPMVYRALGLLVEKSLATTLKEIDDTHTMFERTKPQVVLLRATSSTQTHFIILAQVARVRGVPSLEVQHGLQYYGHGSYTRRYSAEYIGVYGPLTQRNMEDALVGSECTPVVVGSPRFDAYISALKSKSDTPLKPRGAKVSFLCIAPPNDSTGENLDSYTYREYFSAIAFALKNIQNAGIVVKFRPGGAYRDSFSRRMLADIFADMPYTIAQNEPLAELFDVADVVISYHSTAVVEAMQCRKPTVVLALNPVWSLMAVHDFVPYVESGALRLATTKEELVRITGELSEHPEARAKLSSQSAAFLEHNFAFDGHASERTAELIRSLVDKKRTEKMKNDTIAL